MLKLIHSQLPFRLDHTIRFNGIPTIKKESVSQHSYWVMFFVNLIFRDLFWIVLSTNNKEEHFYRLYNYIIRKAMFHDIDECFVSDVTYTTKYHKAIGTGIKDSLNKIFEHEINSYPEENFIKEIKLLIAKENSENFTEEEKLICKQIIKLADWLSLYAYCHQEYRLGNKQEQIINMSEIAKEEMEKLLVSLLKTLEESNLPFNKRALETILAV